MDGDLEKLSLPPSWPNLVLRVAREGEPDREIPIRPGLTIGSQRSNPVHIDAAGVEPVHAVISTAAEGLPFIRASAASPFVMPDGTQTTRLDLVSGVSFMMGSVRLRCRRSNKPVPLRAESSIPSASGECSRCHFDITRLSVQAKFCPKCGGPLGSGGASAPATVTDWRQQLPDARHVAQDGESLERVHSLMLLGYASAMNGLGNRYEAGEGVHRNEREAVRCFLKAARLGNDQAVDRLSQKGIDVSPTPPDQPPPT